MIDPCSRAECANHNSHPSSFHDADMSIENIASLRTVEKIYERFFEAIYDSLPDLDLELPDFSHCEDEDDLTDEFREWATSRIMRKLLD